MAMEALDAAAVEALTKRADKAKHRLQMASTLHRECMRYAMPERDATTGYTEGAERTRHVYDSTATIGVNRFANRLVQAMFPAQQRWSELERGPSLRNLSEAEAKAVDEDLELASRVIFEAIADSNFDLAIVEAALDLACSTAVMTCEPGRVGGRWGAPLLRFQALPLGTVGIEDGLFGAPEGFFHWRAIAGEDIERVWPDATIPPELGEQIRADPKREHDVIHLCVFEPARARWRVAVLWQKHALVDRSSRTSPFVAMRWLKAAGDVYGRGPLVQALPDIRTVNKAKELTLKNAAIEAAGVYTARDDGVLNPHAVRIVPGGVIPVASNGTTGAGRSLDRLPSGRFDLSLFVIEEMQKTIRKTLFDDPLPDEIRSNVSATEIAERMALYAQDTGSFGRLYADGVKPLMWRIVDVLDEAGELPGVVDYVLNEDVRVRPTSPLARMQDIADVDAIDRYLRRAAALEGTQQGATAGGLRIDQAARWLAQTLGVPAELIPTEREIADRREAEGEAQATAQLASSPVAAKVADNLTRPEPNAR